MKICKKCGVEDSEYWWELRLPKGYQKGRLYFCCLQCLYDWAALELYKGG